MAFGTDNLQYGTGFGGTSSEFGSSIYNEYIGDSYVSEDVDVQDYLYEYDPLKEQNLLADYMSGLVDMGDKTEGVRKKAIAERKALSKSISGGLTTGTMVEAEQDSIDAASRAQADIYRGQASAKRKLGESIGSVREAYEADIAEGVEAYNAAIGGDGITVSENTPAGIVTNYAENYGVNDPGGSKVHAIVDGNPSGDYAIRNSGVYGDVGDDDHNDTWLNSSTGNWYKYWDGTVLGMGDGEWQSKGKWNG